MLINLFVCEINVISSLTTNFWGVVVSNMDIESALQDLEGGLEFESSPLGLEYSTVYPL